MTKTANGILRPALKEAAEKLADSYRQKLKSIETKPGNSGQFAWMSVGVKCRAFRDATGAWAIVGAERENGHLKSPQMLWGELGTAKRKTKSRANRGSMPAQRWLELSMQSAFAMAQTGLKTRINQLVSRARVD